MKQIRLDEEQGDWLKNPAASYQMTKDKKGREVLRPLQFSRTNPRKNPFLETVAGGFAAGLGFVGVEKLIGNPAMHKGEEQLYASLKPGDYAYDNSPHRYKGKVRFSWASRQPNGVLVKGQALTLESAKRLAVYYATYRAKNNPDDSTLHMHRSSLYGFVTHRHKNGNLVHSHPGLANPREKPYVVRIVAAPGGSKWTCFNCRRLLQAGEKVAKQGSKVYCAQCIQTVRNIEKPLVVTVPWEIPRKTKGKKR